MPDVFEFHVFFEDSRHVRMKHAVLRIPETGQSPCRIRLLIAGNSAPALKKFKRTQPKTSTMVKRVDGVIIYGPSAGLAPAAAPW